LPPTPAARRQGLARALLTRALAAFPDATTCFLEVAEPNAPARALYANLGFKAKWACGAAITTAATAHAPTRWFWQHRFRCRAQCDPRARFFLLTIPCVAALIRINRSGKGCETGRAVRA
jgi:hypothetical protein